MGASKRNEPASLLSGSPLCDCRCWSVYSRVVSLPFESLAWLSYLSSVPMDQWCSLDSGGTPDVCVVDIDPDREKVITP